MTIRNPWSVVLFGILCLAQLAVPATMLAVRERTLVSGEPFRFRCAPVDPVDVLRGRYVALHFEAARVPAGPRPMRAGERVAVPVEVAPDGFARLGAPAAEPPGSGPWIEVELAQDSPSPDGGTVEVRVPFDRVYMDERRAVATDRVLARSGNERVEAFLVVRVRDGHAVAEDLYLDGVPAREYLDRTR